MADGEQSCGQRISARFSAFGRFMYNSEKGTFLGRTPKSWALIGLFYLIYYSLLAAFFVGMLSVLLFGLISNEVPHLTGDHSLLKMNPGLAIRPQPDVQRTLVQYNIKKPGSEQSNVDDIKQLFNDYSKYKNLSDSGVTYNSKCDLAEPQANRDFDPAKEICVMNPSTVWGPCKAPNFGYDKDGQPCVIVKMNKVYGWLPRVSAQNDSGHALLECYGENDGDAATIGELEYYPNTTFNGKNYGYFSSALFPYINQPGYTPPTVAVRFKGIHRNVLVMVECKLANLENSEYDKTDRQAMVRFEVVVYDHA